jgi:ketosteroid isomerase-like protein
MKGLSIVLAFLALLIAAGARADEFRDAVEAGNRAFKAAFLKGDATAVGELYTVDAKVIAPGAEVANGRAAIAAFWKAASAGAKDVVLTTGVTEFDGDLGYEDGTVTLVDASGKSSTSRYVVVWKREQGVWKLHRDIWN